MEQSADYGEEHDIQHEPSTDEKADTSIGETVAADELGLAPDNVEKEVIITTAAADGHVDQPATETVEAVHTAPLSGSTPGLSEAEAAEAEAEAAEAGEAGESEAETTFENDTAAVLMQHPVLSSPLGTAVESAEQEPQQGTMSAAAEAAKEEAVKTECRDAAPSSMEAVHEAQPVEMQPAAITAEVHTIITTTVEAPDHSIAVRAPDQLVSSETETFPAEHAAAEPKKAAASTHPQEPAEGAQAADHEHKASKPHKETAMERLTTPTAIRMLHTLEQTQGGKTEFHIASGVVYKGKKLASDELAAMVDRLAVPKHAGDASLPPKPHAVKLVYADNKEMLVPVKEVTKEENVQYMAQLYERCKETRAKTQQTLAEKYLQPLTIKPLHPTK